MWQSVAILAAIQLALVLLVAVLPDRLPAALMLLPHLRGPEQKKAKRRAARRRRPKAKKRKPATRSRRKRA